MSEVMKDLKDQGSEVTRVDHMISTIDSPGSRTFAVYSLLISPGSKTANKVNISKYIVCFVD